jgi:DNA-binding NtrC family response regulator
VRNKRILVVDDDKAVLKSVKAILESEDYGVETTREGQQALARFDSEFYDLVLLDIKLPDIDGTKLLETLHDRFPETVKIMVTGYPTLTNAVESLNVGADAYLMKPVNPQRLLKVVNDRLAQREEPQNSSRERKEPPNRSKGKPSSSKREGKKPVDEMIERALSLLQDESQKEAANRPQVRKVETKNDTTSEYAPQSPEQNFWFSLANLDLGNAGISKNPHKPENDAGAR